MWRVDPVSGAQFVDPRDPNQLALQITSQPDLTSLKKRLTEVLTEEGPTTLERLRQFTLFRTLFRETHTKTAVDEMVEEGTVRVRPARSYAAYGVELNPQSSLFDGP